jgi:NitT/TauT family transport system substrate-binding protein
MVSSFVRFLRNCLAASVLLSPLVASPTVAQTTTVRVGANLSTYSNLPIFLAVDKGYFKAAGIDVDVQGFTTSSTAQIPKLARGDVDVMPLALGPAFFNQFSEGFNVKLVAELSSQKQGWNGTTWLVVRQDLWDAGTIRQPKDLRGRSIDGVAPGSPIDFLALTAVKSAGLTEKDVTYTNKFRDVPSWLGALRNKAVDVQGVPEPIATEVEAEKLGHKWVTISTVAPWFHETFLAASSGFARDHHDVLVRFIRAYLKAADDINRSNGKWTPDLIAAVAKWTQLPESTIRQIPGPAYAGDGRIDTASVTRQEEFWHTRGLVNTIIPADAIVDTASIREATSRSR